MALKRKRKPHLPAYHLADAWTLYDQASEKFLLAAEAFQDDAAQRRERILELTALLAGEHKERDHALEQSDAALDIAEHLTKM